jgi:benzodiazapine receptor
MDLSIVAFGIAVLIAASSGAVFKAGPWYEALAKPPWRPPGFLFGPVWLVLYIMIAISGWRVWDASPTVEAALIPMIVYGIQLVLNGIWSAIFFGIKKPGLALFEMVFLWLSIVANIAVFATIDETAAWLLVPYLVWVSFAFVLNLSVWRLNRGTVVDGIQL